MHLKEVYSINVCERESVIFMVSCFDCVTGLGVIFQERTKIKFAEH